MSPFFPRRLPFHLTVPETSLWYNLEVSATRFPNRAALSFGSASVSYREFRAQAEALAGYLQKECGVRRGDRVALFMHNSPQFVIAYYGILRADAVVVPVNCMNTTGELEQLPLDSCASTLATSLPPRSATAIDLATLVTPVTATLPPGASARFRSGVDRFPTVSRMRWKRSLPSGSACPRAACASARAASRGSRRSMSPASLLRWNA